jgi:hypothetical protein
VPAIYRAPVSDFPTQEADSIVGHLSNVAGRAPNTLLKWMKDREFAAAYRKARAAAVGQAIARLLQTTGAAVSTLQKLMVDNNTPAAIKGNVARAVLALAIKGVEVDRDRSARNGVGARRGREQE